MASFADRAKAEAERQADEWLSCGQQPPTTTRHEIAGGSRWGFVGGAIWAHAIDLADPTDEEVAAFASVLAGGLPYGPRTEARARAAIVAFLTARRGSE